MHPDIFPKLIVSLDAKHVVMKEVDVGNQLKNEQEFEFRNHMLQWIHMRASKLRFGVLIGRSDNGLDRRYAFMTMTRERSGKYIPPLQNFKRDDINSRKCECLFKLANKKWRLM